MSELRLGILGLSKGNGHPYSWSAIFNGYDPGAMASCPFPAIPDYLARQSFPKDSIADARVTHVWTQSRSVSEHIASASLIEHVVDNYDDMIEQVDGVLLARDDAENHLEMSRPFLEAGLPVYIDKPVAVNQRDLQSIVALEQFPGQIFSCSALRYARELQISSAEIEDIGAIRYVYATVPKFWQTYAVHIIEPVILVLGEHSTVKDVNTIRSGDQAVVTVLWTNGIMTTFAALGKTATKIQMIVYGDKSSKTYTFTDSFTAFRSALMAFIEGIRTRRRMIPFHTLETIVKIIECGGQP